MAARGSSTCSIQCHKSLHKITQSIALSPCRCQLTAILVPNTSWQLYTPLVAARRLYGRRNGYQVHYILHIEPLLTDLVKTAAIFSWLALIHPSTTSASLGVHNSAWCSWFITFDCNSFIVIERSLVRFWERRNPFLRLQKLCRAAVPLILSLEHVLTF